MRAARRPAQLWLPSFGLTKAEIPELEAAIAAAREEGVDDLWTWGYEACGFMTHLATPDSPLVWEAVSAALTGAPAVETAQHARARERLLNVEDATVSAAVARAGDELAAAVEAIAARIASRRPARLCRRRHVRPARGARRGRKSGRLGSPPGEVVAIVAGDGEDAEDDAERGDADVRALAIGRRTPSSRSARAARRRTRSPRSRPPVPPVRSVLHSFAPPTPRSLPSPSTRSPFLVGPEVVSGSTRLKAGTAQKLVLNAISTATMIRLGRTFAGLMVGVAPENAKLRERARRNVVIASGRSEADVDEALVAAEGDARVALVTLLAGVDP